MIRTYLNTHLHSLLSRSLHTHRYLEMISVMNDHGIYDAHPTVRPTFVPTSLLNSNVLGGFCREKQYSLPTVLCSSLI